MNLMHIMHCLFRVQGGYLCLCHVPAELLKNNSNLFPVPPNPMLFSLCQVVEFIF